MGISWDVFMPCHPPPKGELAPTPRGQLWEYFASNVQRANGHLPKCLERSVCANPESLGVHLWWTNKPGRGVGMCRLVSCGCVWRGDSVDNCGSDLYFRHGVASGLDSAFSVLVMCAARRDRAAGIRRPGGAGGGVAGRHPVRVAARAVAQQAAPGRLGLQFGFRFQMISIVGLKFRPKICQLRPKNYFCLNLGLTLC